LQYLSRHFLTFRKEIILVEGVTMLLSSISSSLVSSAAASSAISMMTKPGLPQYGAAIVVGLIALLSLKEVCSASEKWNKYLNNSFNMAIIPLFFSFVAIVVFNIIMIIRP
jgi:hypothetical protein